MASRKQLIAGMVKDIVAQANAIPDGWLTLELEADEQLDVKAGSIKVPRIPFERWGHETHFHRTDEWRNVAPTGLKLQMDNPDHSDWWLGAGLSLDNIYEHWRENKKYTRKQKLSLQVNQSAWVYFMRSNYTAGGNNCSFLAKPRKEVTGRVMWVRNKKEIKEFVEQAISWKKVSNSQEMIALIPNASVEFDLILPHAAAVITVIGNKVAHIVKVAREDAIPVILCPDGFQRFFHYERVKIDSKGVRRCRY